MTYRSAAGKAPVIDWETQKKLDSELMETVFSGDLKRAEQFIEAGADVNAKDEEGWTALHYAVYREIPKCINMLVINGADANAKDNGGWTPLHHAARCGNIGCMRQLVENGADMDTRNILGKTPADILAGRYPRLYAEHIKSLMDMRPEAQRLGTEDTAKSADTGFEFDI